MADLKVFPSKELRTKFKMMCAQIGVTMSQRVVKFMETEVQHWEETGKPLNLERFSKKAGASLEESQQPPHHQIVIERVAAEDVDKLAKLTSIPKKRLKKIASGNALSEEDAVRISQVLSIELPEEK